MKLLDVVVGLVGDRPAPHGAGGLKSVYFVEVSRDVVVPPRMGRVD